MRSTSDINFNVKGGHYMYIVEEHVEVDFSNKCKDFMMSQ